MKDRHHTKLGFPQVLERRLLKREADRQIHEETDESGTIDRPQINSDDILSEFFYGHLQDYEIDRRNRWQYLNPFK